MSNTPDGDRVIALAGLYQATTLVQQVARQGSADNAPFEVSIASLLRIDSESAAQVFGGRNGVVCGLKTLCRQLSRRGRDLELTRYSVCLLFLERKLARRHDLKRAVLDGIRNAIDQAEYFDTTHDCVLANLASIYTSTVSTLSPRIMVTGAPQHLNHPGNANKIRALLLAGLRATVLWRQLGGNRLHLLLGRTRIVSSAEEMLRVLEARRTDA